jgi:hypothetical protein
VRNGVVRLAIKPFAAGGRDTCVPYVFAISRAEKALKRKTMADHDPHDLTNARKVLVELRHNWAKAIAASDNTEVAIKSIIEVQQAIDVIDHAIDEFADTEEDDEDEDDE